MDHVGTGSVLAGLGILLLVTSVVSGSLSSGYGIWTPEVLLRIGLVYTVLGAVTIRSRSMSLGRAVSAAATTLLIVLAGGVAVMYYDLVVTPSEFGTPLTTRLLIATQITVTIGVAPVPAGFVAGILEGQNRPNEAFRVLVVTTILSVVAGALWVVTQDYAGIVMLFLSSSAVVGALPPLLLIRRMHGRGWLLAPKTTESDQGSA